jgi:hypothetical protein
MMRSSMTVAQNVLDYFDGRSLEGRIVNPEVLKR